MRMELLGFKEYDILNILDSDYKNILEYKISRTTDKRLILDVKFDVSEAMLELNTGTIEKSEDQCTQE